MSNLHPYFGHLVRILHWCTDQYVTRTVEDMELTAAQGRILGYLADHREAPPCPRDIEEVFHLSHPTVSGLLTRLEQKGFLETHPDPADRRCKRVCLLPKGEQYHQRIHEAIHESEQRMLAGFLPEEREAFAAYLKRAIHNMGDCPCKKSDKEEPQK